MRFALTAEQTAMRDAVRQVLAAGCPPEVVRGAWDGDPPERLWRDLAEMGVPGTLVPEERGGLGLSDVHLVAVLTEVGYAAVPLPVAETAAVAGPLLAAAGDPGGHLAGILAGSTRVALVGPTGIAPYGRHCDLFLSLPGPPDVPGPSGVAWLATRSEVDTGPVSTMDSVPGSAPDSPGTGDARTDPVSTVDASRAALRVRAAGQPLPVTAGQLAAAGDRAALATAAQLVGLGRRMLDLTVDYVRGRRQFGVPVGSFQAVKHQLADALLGLEFAFPAVLRAAWSAGHDTAARGRDVAMAYVLAAEAATGTARTAIQCHGAMGYTVEYDLHLYAKRTWALAAAGGGVDAHLARIADDLGVSP